MNQTHHLNKISAHTPFNKVEAAHQQSVLSFVQQHGDFYKRSLKKGHITGSAWIINPQYNHVLMLHHKKLDRWLQPGGHTEQDADVLATARREAQEETGILDLRTISDAIFDIDIHTIPGNKKEAEHLHYDIRYLFETALTTAPTVSDESNDVRWFTLEEIASSNDEASIARMILKTTHLRENKSSS